MLLLCPYYVRLHPPSCLHAFMLGLLLLSIWLPRWKSFVNSLVEKSEHATRALVFKNSGYKQFKDPQDQFSCPRTDVYGSRVGPGSERAAEPRWMKSSSLEEGRSRQTRQIRWSWFLSTLHLLHTSLFRPTLPPAQLRTFFSVGGVDSSQFGPAALKLCVDLVLVALDFICWGLNIRVKPPVPTPGSIIFHATQNRRTAATVLMSLKRSCTIHAEKTNYTSFVSSVTARSSEPFKLCLP